MATVVLEKLLITNFLSLSCSNSLTVMSTLIKSNCAITPEFTLLERKKKTLKGKSGIF